jgi:transcription initiation factor TFIID TATA-box-binding protein
MRKRRYFSLPNKQKRGLLQLSTSQVEAESADEHDERHVGAEGTSPRTDAAPEQREEVPIPRCHNIVSTSQIQTTLKEINLQRLASLFPFTSYDRKRFAAITIRLANPHCTCLLFGSGKLVITGSTSFHACLVASQTITQLLREVNPREQFGVISCVIQNIVAHVELKPGQQINLEGLYSKYCEHSTYQKSIFPGLVLRPPESPIVLLVFKSGRIVCTGGKSYDDIYYGFMNMFKVLKEYIYETGAP